MSAVKRILPAIVAFALVIAGVGAGILLLTSRDHSSISGSQEQTKTVTGPHHLPAGNIVVEFNDPADGIRIDQLAERLGAIDTKETRAAGQALVSKKVDTPGVTAQSGEGDLTVESATDPKLAAFIRQYLGRTAP
jgi:hypothetical protein